VLKSLILSLAAFFSICVCAYPATNMLKNAGFETAGSSFAQYWERNYPDTHGASWGSASRQTWRTMGGSFEGAILGTWAGAYTNGGCWQEVPATPNRQYRFATLLFADDWGNKWTSTVHGIKLEFYTASTGLLYAVSNIFNDISDHWGGHSVQAVAPINTAWMRAVIFAEGLGPNGALQFDDVSLIEVSTVTNRLGPSSRRSGMIISEIMYHPQDRADAKNLEYVELYNTVPVSQKLDGYQLKGSIDYVFPAGTTVSGFSFVVVAKDVAAVQSVYGAANVIGPYTGSLPNDEGTVKLKDTLGAELLIVDYEDQTPWPAAADGAGHSLVLSKPSIGEGDAAAWSASSRFGGSPGTNDPLSSASYAGIVINEFNAHSDNSTGDYIEVYNAGTQSVDLANCWLSNDPATNKYRITNTVLAAGAFAQWMTNRLNFNLESESGVIFLRAPNSNVIDGVRYTAQQNSVPSGRYPDGAAGFQELQTTTQGTNNRPYLARAIVINEVMFHPISENNDDEYVELFNQASIEVDVSLWQFVDGITYTIPDGTLIPASNYLVVAKNKARLLAVYTNLNAANLVGNYSGSLADSGERLALAKPHDTNDLVVVDEVTYRDGGRWGKWSDGGGSSLELKDPHSDNRLAANWADSDETAKGTWTNVTCTGVLDLGNNVWYAGIDELHLLMLKKGECLVDNVVVSNSTGGGNLVANSTFEGGVSGWTVEGAFVRSGLESNGYSSARSLHVRASAGGDTGANRIKTSLSSTLSAGATATISAMARWVCGSPYVLMRVRGNYLEATRALPVPANLGTPGARNSRYAANVGPAISEVVHAPILPAANAAVTVFARIHDPDGIQTAQLKYRIDPSVTTNTITMTNRGAGVYSGVITGQPSGKVVAFWITATDSNAASASFPDDAPARSCIVRFGEALTSTDFGAYRFWLTKSNLDLWASRAPLGDEPYDMTLVYNDERVIYNAEIRYRGSPFIRTWYAGPLTGVNSYVMSPPKDDRFLGSDEFNLDTLEPWEGRDETRQRERISFRMAEGLGLPICYQRLVHITLNGYAHSDVYADSHHVDSDYIKESFPDNSDGQLFKFDDWFEFGSSYGEFVATDAELQNHITTGGVKKKARYRWNLERKSNGPHDDNYSNLFSLVDAANLTNGEYTASMEAVVDVQEWMRLIALRHVVVDWDAYGFRRGKNMFMYRPEDDRWRLLLWDMDMGLGASVESSNNCPVLEVVDSTMPVIARVVAHPPFQRLYWQALYDAVNGPMMSSVCEPPMDEWCEKMQQSGVGAENPAAVKSWLSGRRAFMISQLNPVTNISVTITSNGGSDFTITSNLVTLSGIAPIQAKFIRINGKDYDLTWTTVTNWTAQVALSDGTNNLVVQSFDSAGNLIAGLTDSIKVNYTGTNVSPVGQLVIDEIMYHPAVTNAEYVEIRNLSLTHAFDLSGWRLDGVDCTFPSGTVIRAGAYAVVAENSAVYAAVYTNALVLIGEYDGKLSGGETLQLIKRAGTNADVLVDMVYFDDDPPWPSTADGLGRSLQLIDVAEDNNRIGNWAASTNGSVYTPGASNSVCRDLLPFPNLWINELQTTNTVGLRDNAGDRDPWLELYNADAGDVTLTNYYLTDTYTNLVKWRVTGNSTVSADGFHVVWMDAEPGETVFMTNHATFRLSSTTGSLALVRSNGSEIVIVDYVNYAAIASDRSYGDAPDGVWTNRLYFSYPSPRATNNVAALVSVFINEWMADNDAVLADPADGQYEDWFELYNAGTNTVDLSGYTLTDNLGTPAKWVVSNGVSIAAGGFLVVWADGEPKQNTNGVHADFSLSKGGEALGLYAPDGAAIDMITFGTQTLNVSEGRWWDGQPGVYAMAVPTPGQPNIVSTNNSPPVLSVIGPRNVDEESTLSFTVSATDTDMPPQKLTFFLRTGAPPGMSLNPTNGLFLWNPDEEDGPMVTSVTIRVTDNGWTNRIDLETFTITVNEVNEEPEIEDVKDVRINPGSLVVLGVSAEDDDIPANALTFSLDAGYPDGASITPDGIFSWEPSDTQFSTTNTIVVRVTDDGSPAESETESFVIEVSGMDELFDAEVTALPGTNGFTITWGAISGEMYRVDYQQTLFDSTWTNLPPNVRASNVVASTVDTTTNEATQRFYRILRLLP
jgi:hypothetical protein